ncbi:hypothetical protein FAGKG844_20223 [Frankia sp. AgKG'84/4]
MDATRDPRDRAVTRGLAARVPRPVFAARPGPQSAQTAVASARGAQAPGRNCESGGQSDEGSL